MTLTGYETAKWLWKRLRRAFPYAVAAMIMRDHLHLLVPVEDPSEARVALGAVISALRRSSNPASRNRWGKVYASEVIYTPEKIARQIRYIVLNPARAGYVDCPLAWRWSSHRDVMGTVVDTWVTADRVARALGAMPDGFRERHQRYVSSDPSTRVDGTPVPQSYRGRMDGFAPQHAVVAASAAAREEPSAVMRRGVARRQFLGVARRAGWTVASIAATCGISPQRVRAYLAEELPVDESVWACLGDERLR